MSENFKELHLIGLAGPTHNYAGLAEGNLASTHNAMLESSPLEAALQSISLMRFLNNQEIPVVVMPPHIRPNNKLIKKNLFAAYSAANMWVANAATVSAAYDCQDKKIHITPANMLRTGHRTQEAEVNAQLLAHIFNDQNFFIHNKILQDPDEGAANHCRVFSKYDNTWHNIFVYGFDYKNCDTKTFKPRQSKEAFIQIIAQHKLNPKYCHIIQQNPQAIDAGVFHNDVITLNNHNLLIIHEKAWCNQNDMLEKLSGVHIITVKESELSLVDAVKSYFFNAQLITAKDQSMILILPIESQTTAITSLIARWISNPEIPINKVYYINLKQSMQNGGGPACLRLRIPIAEDALIGINKHFFATDQLLDNLTSFVKEHYPAKLSYMDLGSKNFDKNFEKIFIKLYAIFNTMLYT